MLFLNQKEKVENEHWLSSLNKLSSLLLFLVLLFLPTQFGLHTWPFFSFVAGQRVDYLSPTFYVTDVLLFLLAVISLPFLIKGTRLLFMLVLLFLGIGIFLSQNPFAGWWHLIKVCEFVFFAWFVAHRLQQVRKYIPLTFGIGLLFEGLLALSQLHMQHALGGIFYFLGERLFSASTPGIANASINGALVLRPYGTFSHPNVLAGYVLFATLLMFLFVLQKKKLWWVSFLLFCFGSIVLFLTLSRLALAAWFVGLAFILFQKIGRKKQVGIGLLLLCSLGVLFSVGLFRFRFFPFLFSDESVVLRLQLSQAAISMLFSHPFFGVGFANFLNQLPSYLPQVSFSQLQPVHNIFLLVGAETGFIGLLGFLFFLFVSLKKAWQKKYELLFLWACLCLVAVCFIGVGDHYFLTLQQGQLLFSLVLGLAWAKTASHT